MHKLGVDLCIEFRPPGKGYCTVKTMPHIILMFKYMPRGHWRLRSSYLQNVPSDDVWLLGWDGNAPHHSHPRHTLDIEARTLFTNTSSYSFELKDPYTCAHVSRPTYLRIFSVTGTGHLEQILLKSVCPASGVRSGPTPMVSLCV